MISTAIPFRLKPGQLTLLDLRRAYESPVRVSIEDADLQRVSAAAEAVSAIIARDRPAYGINTGFGLLAQTRIPSGELENLQRNLLLSHAAGVGALLPDEIVRLILILKVASLARGYSGVRRELIAALCKLLEHEVYPCVPAKGSVGASGDLAPLAHMCLPLIGAGTVRHRGKILPAAEGLQLAGLAPLTLAPKEGLALINGTQASTALALAGLFKTENIFAAAMIAGALSVEALKGSDAPFDPRIHDARGHAGQGDVATIYRSLLEGSEIRASHLTCSRVQDPYSLRCQPQVMGACLDALRHIARTLQIEANAVTDNPLIFVEDGSVVSGGNFHAEPVAFVADFMALALAETASLSERRISLLVDPKMSALPAFLVKDSGTNSGFMIAQVTAAALVSENKSRAHPASVDSIPTSANQEDHVSMATFAALRLSEMAANSASVVGIELLAAAQGIDFHRPMRSSPMLEGVHADLRREVPRYDRDRYMAPDIEVASEWALSGKLNALVGHLLPSS